VSEDNKDLTIDFGGLTYAAKEYVFSFGNFESRFMIRHFPASLVDYEIDNVTGRRVMTGESMRRHFIYSFVAANPFKDAQGNPLELTEEVKRRIYDFKDRKIMFAALVNFVLARSNAIGEELENELGN